MLSAFDKLIKMSINHRGHEAHRERIFNSVTSERSVVRPQKIIQSTQFKCKFYTSEIGGVNLMNKILCFCISAMILAGPLAVEAQDVQEDEMLLAMYFDMDQHLDQKIEVATKVPKPLRQIAENVTVVTAEEIQQMQAHTTSEVLDRMPGIYMATWGRDFGQTGSMTIQGSEYDHVLVLVDGIDWNFISGGNANLNTIPVTIIKRIEVIRGPGSSTWGSSLGGVVNIITKVTGTEKTSNILSASLGERDTTDSRVELSGSAGPVGYYLFGGKQRSDGLRNDRDFDNHMLYGKAKFNLNPRFSVELTSGYSEPHVNYGHLVSGWMLADEVDRAFWTTLSADASLSDAMTLNISLYTYDQKFALHLIEDGFWGWPSAGDLYRNTFNDEKKRGASGRLAWQHANHTVVGGLEYLRSEIDATMEYGVWDVIINSFPPVFSTSGGLDETAFYVNDTIVFDKFTLTPGIRYDRNSVTESFTSPSLGLTYQLNDKTLLRAQAAKGFNLPDFGETSIGGPFYDPNPNLQVEEIVSLQAGFETWALEHLWLKGTYFDHDIKDAITTTFNPATGNDISVNEDKQRRQGFELEARINPFYHFTLQGNFSYVHLEKYGSSDNQSKYTSNLALIYNNDTLSAGLYGHYIWHDYGSAANYDDFIWDVTINKRITLSESVAIDLFAAGHNIFNGIQENHTDNPTIKRWLEAGVRFYF